jgi:hypothetical protein
MVDKLKGILTGILLLSVMGNEIAPHRRCFCKKKGGWCKASRVGKKLAILYAAHSQTVIPLIAMDS